MSWRNLASDLLWRMNYQIVLTVINATSQRNIKKTKERKLHAAGMALSLLLKTRNQTMSAGQLVTSAVLLKAGITRMATDSNSQLMNRLKLFKLWQEVEVAFLK